MKNILKNSPVLLIIAAMIIGAITYNYQDAWFGLKYIAYICFVYLLYIFGKALFYAFKK